MKLTDEEREAIQVVIDDLRDSDSMSAAFTETALTKINATALAVLERLLNTPTGQQSDGYHTFDELYDHRITWWKESARLI